MSWFTYAMDIVSSWPKVEKIREKFPPSPRPIQTTVLLLRGNGLWRAVTAAEGGGDKSEEDAMSSFLKRTGNKSLERKRPAIHFLISIPLPQPFDLYVHLDYN